MGLVRDAAQQKLAMIEQRIADNQTLQKDDHALIVACAQEALAILVSSTPAEQE